MAVEAYRYVSILDGCCLAPDSPIKTRSCRLWLATRQSLVVALLNLPEYLASLHTSPPVQSSPRFLFSRYPNSSYCSLH